MQSWQKKFVRSAALTGMSLSPPHSGHCFRFPITVSLIAIAPFLMSRARQVERIPASC